MAENTSTDLASTMQCGECGKVMPRGGHRFPRTSPASGTVAVRRHHVFVLLSHVSGTTWLVWDANSGGRKTRVHHRSIAGWAIVNPHGSRMASND